MAFKTANTTLISAKVTALEQVDTLADYYAGPVVVSGTVCTDHYLMAGESPSNDTAGGCSERYTLSAIEKAYPATLFFHHILWTAFYTPLNSITPEPVCCTDSDLESRVLVRCTMDDGRCDVIWDMRMRWLRSALIPNNVLADLSAWLQSRLECRSMHADAPAVLPRLYSSGSHHRLHFSVSTACRKTESVHSSQTGPSSYRPTYGNKTFLYQSSIATPAWC